jgi:methionyl-tRNA formyltransferase
VVTQPDREKGRGRKVYFSPVKGLALQHGLIPIQPEKAKEEAFQGALNILQPDLIVVVAYGQILPKSILKIPKHGAAMFMPPYFPNIGEPLPLPGQSSMERK